MTERDIEKKLAMLVVQINIERRYENLATIDELIKKCAAEIFESFNLPKELEKLYYPKGRIVNTHDPL